MRPRGLVGIALVFVVTLALAVTAGWSQGKPPIKVALVAAMSGGSALSGEAIKRGLSVAIDEINANGGLLGGRKVELVVRDEEGNPSKGVTAARDVIEREGAVAVFGGLHSPVGLAMLPVFHELKVPYVGTWAAATGITRDVPTVSHWGIRGGRFSELTGELSQSVVFVQTYTFFGRQSDVGDRVISALKAKYAVKGPEDILAPVGTANAYDAMHLVGLAVEKAGAADGARIRDALEGLG